ncbi:hypothetical protein THRCLA_02208 [Thraustotheca clavata]|uniref:DUF4440 domain-containing protein n=1 Tax=Thraustotheca clavata TaxID=74557 RepID=A0A1W0A5Y5_9STRA|nr:hypothetical protein THRCLA_02208 [Thraustotheca clavata]
MRGNWSALARLNSLNIGEKSTLYTAETAKGALTGFAAHNEAARSPVPPFTKETALAKVKAAEDGWNSRDANKVALAYTPDTVWRNRDQIFVGREAVVKFLQEKWALETNYKLVKHLWCSEGDRIAVRFTYEFQRISDGQWFRCHGNELWQFDSQGLMQHRDMSGNDVPIEESDRLFQSQDTHSFLGRKMNLTMEEANAACATYTTCDDCIKASMTCHFCEFDLQCHAIGSPSGCVRGMTACHHIEDCIRKEPQPIGYGPPPSVVLAVLCLVATLLACCCGVSILVTMMCKCCRRKPKMIKKRYAIDLAADEASKEALLSQTIEDEEVMFTATPIDDLDESQSREGRSSLRSCGISMIWLALFATLTTLSLMYYPRIPDYQICNQQFDWESIFLSLKSIHPKIDYQILTSVSNENRFAFHLKAGDADIHHRGVKVGTWTIRNWTAEAGAVTDMMADVRIEPGYTEAYSLWEDFRQGTLVFQINTTISGSIKWGNYTVYDIETQVPAIEFLVGAKYPRDLCKCTEYYEPQNSSIFLP